MIINQTFIFKCLGDSTVAISAFMVMIDATDTLFKIGVFIFTSKTRSMVVEAAPCKLCYGE